MHRLEKDRKHKASLRASETSVQTLRDVSNTESTGARTRAAKKASYVSVQQAIMSFHSDIRNGPDFVCTSCQRLMYSRSVIPRNTAKGGRHRDQTNRRAESTWQA